MNTKHIVFLIIVFTTLQSVSVFGQENTKAKLEIDSIKYFVGQDFVIIGRFHNEKNYNRFPQKYKNTVRPEVWELSQNSAGIAIRFRTNATDIKIKWTTLFDAYLPHMAPTGVKGLDLYANVNGTWQFVQTARPKSKTSEYVMIENGEPVYREYLLNLPLYDGVDSLFIGVNESAEISKPKERFMLDKKPVVYYGSSIAQGGCASRPGMAYTNILSRKLDRAFMNFGFSGEGTFDTSVGEAMLEVDAALYVIDCNPNTEVELIYNKAVALVQQLKKAKPNVPVLLVENYNYTNALFKPKNSKKSGNSSPREMCGEKQLELEKAYLTLMKSGVANLYFQKGVYLIGDDNEATVDGVHLTDLGMQRFANAIYPQINTILQNP